MSQLSRQGFVWVVEVKKKQRRSQWQRWGRMYFEREGEATHHAKDIEECQDEYITRVRKYVFRQWPEKRAKQERFWSDMRDAWSRSAVELGVKRAKKEKSK